MDQPKAPSGMTVREIVVAHLKAGGFDGLAGEDCGCGLDDLMCCEEYRIADCKPARKIVCKEDGYTHCEHCIGECNAAEKETAFIFQTVPSAHAKEEETHL